MQLTARHDRQFAARPASDVPVESCGVSEVVGGGSCPCVISPDSALVVRGAGGVGRRFTNGMVGIGVRVLDMTPVRYLLVGQVDFGSRPAIASAVFHGECSFELVASPDVFCMVLDSHG